MYTLHAILPPQLSRRLMMGKLIEKSKENVEMAAGQRNHERKSFQVHTQLSSVYR